MPDARYTLIGLATLLTTCLLVACGGSSPSQSTDSPTAMSDPPDPPDGADPPAQMFGNVTKAICGPGSRPEPGLQGQVPITERMNGGSEAGYTCNMELVGQAPEEGASWQFAWFDDCGYFGTGNGAGQLNPGVAVVDASDPTNPQVTAHLDTAAMLDPWESLKVNEARGLLGAAAADSGFGGMEVDLYDISQDCSQPMLLSSVAAAGTTQVGHAGAFAPDGNTYYATTAGRTIHALDITDATAPTLITELSAAAHDLSISPDGNRAYVAQLGTSGSNANGLLILDVSAIQSRALVPSAPVVGVLTWEDGAVAQNTELVMIGGNPYVIQTDELGAAAGAGGGACSTGLPLFGMARIIDVSDETQPQMVSTLMLEINDPEVCEMAAMDVNGEGIFGYDSHYCTVDDPTNAEVLGCGHFQAGVRIFDIRDPASVKEIAYYNPPAKPGNTLAGSDNDGNDTADWASSNVRFIRERGEVWFTSQDNGFQIVRFTNGAWPFPAPGNE